MTDSGYRLYTFIGGPADGQQFGAREQAGSVVFRGGPWDGARYVLDGDRGVGTYEPDATDG